MELSPVLLRLPLCPEQHHHLGKCKKVQWWVTLILLGFPALSQHNPDPTKPLSQYKPQRSVEEIGSYFIDTHMPTHSSPSCKRITQNTTNTQVQRKDTDTGESTTFLQTPPMIPLEKAHWLDKGHQLAPWPVKGSRYRWRHLGRGSESEREERMLSRCQSLMNEMESVAAEPAVIFNKVNT